MITKLFSIKDEKAGFGPVFETMNEGLAVRQFGQDCSRPAPDGRINMLIECPKDYSLYVVGEWDNEKAQLIPMEPKQIATASQYVQK